MLHVFCGLRYVLASLGLVANAFSNVFHFPLSHNSLACFNSVTCCTGFVHYVFYLAYISQRLLIICDTSYYKQCIKTGGNELFVQISKERRRVT